MIPLFCTILLTTWFDTKEDALQEFSCRFFALEPTELHIKKHAAPEDLAESGLGDPIFIVMDKNNTPKGVIKTISLESPDGEYTFKAEYESLELLHKLPLKQFRSVALIGIGETTLHGVKTGLIAEEFAKGYSLNHYLKRIAKTTRPKERTKLITELSRGVEKVALALAELHTYKKFPEPAANYLAKYSEEKLPGPFGIIHGDTHPGNIFYDPDTDTLSFIDFSNTYPSRSGAPILQDAANFLLTLEIFSSYYHLTQEEQTCLSSTFWTTYKKNVPNVTDEALSFYKTYFIKTFANLDTWDKKQAHQAKFVHNYCKDLI